jgi:hypothetical protein
LRSGRGNRNRGRGNYAEGSKIGFRVSPEQGSVQPVQSFVFVHHHLFLFGCVQFLELLFQKADTLRQRVVLAH